MLAVGLWTLAGALLTLGTLYRDPVGQLKWSDFVNIYTMGDIARAGPVSTLYDGEAEYRRQVALVPESAPERYLPVYPPQIALILAPFSHFSYHQAAVLWALLTATVYAASVWLAWRAVRSALPDSVLVAAAAAAFPPFWNTILHGQTTVVPILAFAGGAAALARDRKVLAGVVMGLLFIKPHFGLMLAVVVLVCREWRMLAGLAISAVVQGALVAGVLTPAVWFDYAAMLPRMAGWQDALAPRLDQMHSLASVTNLLPDVIALPVWFASCLWVAVITVRVWRSPGPLTRRMGVLVLGSVLVNPHVVVYDVAVLAAPLVWLTGWFEGSSSASLEARRQWRAALYALFVLLLMPTARFVPVQLSPVVMLWCLHAVWRFDERAMVPAIDEVHPA
jgi:hypothetical protein